MQQRNTYDYTQLDQANDSRKNTVLRKTYALLGVGFIPCAIGAYVGMSFNFMNIFGRSSWLGIIGFMVVFYALSYIVEKNRYNWIGAAVMLAITFILGQMLTPILWLALHNPAGARIVEMAALMTAGVFLTMAVLAYRLKSINTNAISRFLFVGVIVLLLGIILNIFLQLPALYLTIAAGFVIFSSLMIMWQIRVVIDGGEDSYISAALTLFISLYNIFVSLVQILTALSDNR